MRVLVTGATGFIGGHVIAALQGAGHHVIGCARNPSSASKRFVDVGALAADFSRDHRIEDWLPRLAGIDVVINCVGIIREQSGQRFDALRRDAPIALFLACERAGVKKVIQISALGADETATSHYHLSKKAADDELARLAMPWAILQPSIVYGPGAKSSAFFRALSVLPIVPLVADGAQPVQPVHIDDLTAMVLRAVESDDLTGRRIPVVGPEAITMKQLLLTWRRWFGLSAPRFVSVPYAVALSGARFAGFLGAMPVNGDAVRMLVRGNTGDVTPMRAVLGRDPIRMEEAVARTPAQEPDWWHARLYFLLPLLRVSLALLWIVTGIVSAALYPAQGSYALLADVGIQGWLAPLALHIAAALDVSLGTALLMKRHVVFVGLIQIAVMVAYSLLITIGLPEYWIHPFGPVTKNMPLIVATLIVIAAEPRP